MVLLLCTCPGGTGEPRPVREQCQLLSPTGPGGGLGPGLVLAQAEPHLLANAEGLHFPGGPFHSKSKRPVAGAGASVLFWLWSWLRCHLLIHRRAGCVAMCLLLWLCSVFLSDQAAGLRCPLQCMEDCLLSVSKGIFIRSYFNIKICMSQNETFACGMSGLSGIQLGRCWRSAAEQGGLVEQYSHGGMFVSCARATELRGNRKEKRV